MTVIDKDWIQLEETLDRMLDYRIERGVKLMTGEAREHNAGWIDALEHVLRMRRGLR